MAVNNAIILYWNKADTATVTASSEALPANRVQDPRPGRVWRATGYTSESLTFDHGSSVDMTHGAVVAHNLSAVGTIRCEVADVADFSTKLYDQTIEAWPPVSGFGSDRFGVSLGGYPTLSSFADYRPFNMFDFGGTLAARYVRYTFTSSAASGNIQVGRIFTGIGYQPEVNFSYGWSSEWADPSELVETEASFFVIRRQKYRVLRLSLENVPQTEALSALDDLKRIVGKSRDVLVVLFPGADLPTQYRTSIYGIPIENGPVSNPYFQRFATSVAVRELVA
ncbi:hypothetical protein FZ983_32360 [Azospirillum sp. B21]|uniref:hypothetical protein n=1 Tax=Azospirillum sp. B21 TaxID=2607496 RepID=UPI0011ECB3D4|nr:hypothetical protein [Azospirillum sp. B21]KAA0572266.1 hypothetical protein FZ983_32360 [Azospirillum sp. B21]